MQSYTYATLHYFDSQQAFRSILWQVWQDGLLQSRKNIFALQNISILSVHMGDIYITIDNNNRNNKCKILEFCLRMFLWSLSLRLWRAEAEEHKIFPSPPPLR